MSLEPKKVTNLKGDLSKFSRAKILFTFVSGISKLSIDDFQLKLNFPLKTQEALCKNSIS